MLKVRVRPSAEMSGSGAIAPFSLVEQPRFRAAFDFMRLRADVGEVDVVLADWWQEFSTGDDNLRQDLIDQVREEQTRQRAQAPRQPAARTASSERQPDAPRAAETESSAEDGAAPKKRRRRRRSGAKKSGDGAPDAGT